VTTGDAADITASGATIAGTAIPNGSATTAWFRFGDFDPGTCDDSFGTRAPESGGFTLGGGTGPVDFEQALTGLEPKRTYYYCAAASNMAGAAFGEVLSFTTEGVPPVVKTEQPFLGKQSVTLNGAANPMGSETTAWFRFDTVDPGACNDTFGTRAPTADGTALGAGEEDVPFSESVTMPPGTYYFCAISMNEAGLGFGEVLTFDVSEASRPTTPPDAGGCGCRVGSSSSVGGSVVSLVGLLLLASRRRRRRAA
jgi:MYXO-CTERM domain-containing protein